MPPQSGPASDIADAIYLPDNKAWVAGFLPPIWLIWHRLWWGFAIYIAYLTILFLLALTAWKLAAILLTAIPGIYLFLEGHELVRQRYENKGWWQIGVVQGNTEEDAILRYAHKSSIQVSPTDDTDVSADKRHQYLKNNSDQRNNQPNSIGLFPMDDPA